MHQNAIEGQGLEPDDIRWMVTYISEHRTSTEPFDVVKLGQTTDANDTGYVAACAEAGATWWLEHFMPGDTTLEATQARICQGPPRLRS